MCSPCMAGAHGVKRGCGSPGAGVKVVVDHCVGAGNKTCVLSRSTSAVNL